MPSLSEILNAMNVAENKATLSKVDGTALDNTFYGAHPLDVDLKKSITDALEEARSRSSAVVREILSDYIKTKNFDNLKQRSLALRPGVPVDPDEVVVYKANLVKATALLEHGGVPMNPPVQCQAGTPVGVLDAQMDRNDLLKMKGSWVHVKVLATGKRGWIPGAALADDALKDFAYREGFTGFTGKSYGNYVLTYDGASNPISWLDNCPACGEAWELHNLKETTTTGRTSWNSPGFYAKAALAIDEPRPIGTRHDTEILYSALRYVGGLMDDKEKTRLETAINSKRFQELTKLTQNRTLALTATNKGWGANAQVMIGVLHTAESNRAYAGHSGAARDGFDQVCMILGFNYSPPLPEDQSLLSRSGEEIPAHYVEAPKNEKYKCAAPRVLQAALQAREYPYSLTEVWYDPAQQHPSYDNAHTIESCDQCRRNVFYMLCPAE